MDRLTIQRGNSANGVQQLPSYGLREPSPAEILGMPTGFNREWAEQIERAARMDARQEGMERLLSEIRQTQIDRARISEEQDKRLTALENSAWTSQKFFAALPRLVAVGTILGMIAGLVIWLLKHLHL